MMVTHRHAALDPGREAIAARLAALSWGAFFVWLGIAFITDVGMGVGLIGVGIITLGTQLARRSLHLPMEGFWLVAGALFTLGGLWDLLRIGVPLIPIVLVVVGLSIVGLGFRGRRPQARTTPEPPGGEGTSGPPS